MLSSLLPHTRSCTIPPPSSIGQVLCFIGLAIFLRFISRREVTKPVDSIAFLSDPMRRNMRLITGIKHSPLGGVAFGITTERVRCEQYPGGAHTGYHGVRTAGAAADTKS